MPLVQTSLPPGMCMQNVQNAVICVIGYAYIIVGLNRRQYIITCRVGMYAVRMYAMRMDNAH
eukprot:1178555-Prorocentrum_minimum.AAC.1